MTLDVPNSPRTRVGIDLVRVSSIAQSLADFGPRFARRLFAAGELRGAAAAGGFDALALAQRFAAKEAAIKAFDLAEAGVGWREIELVDEPGPARRVRLHGRAAEFAARCGTYEIAATLSAEGDLACAIVVARRRGGRGARDEDARDDAHP